METQRYFNVVEKENGMHKHLLFSTIVIIGVMMAALAQTPAPAPISANPAEQARIKPLVDAESKAREALLAKTTALPESATVKAAKDAYDKALADLNKAAEKLPEYSAWKEAGAKSLDEAYRILAERKLSSREFKPELNAKSELIFTRIVPPSQ